MKIKTRKIFRIIFSAIIILIMGGFLVNWYMRNRLEGLLREKLSEYISQATGGFYQFRSQHLNIGLLNGELTLRGVELQPDSLVFHQWASKDSLPQNYFDIEIERIHFKGLNLIWLFSYRQLHFDLFEIERPLVQVFDSENLSRTEVKKKKQESKSLYEIVSPYIDVLTVKKMNLEHASITYIADDKAIPTIYGLKDVSFHAYGFVLDKESSQSGKLLLCDDFDFTTNQPQVLLSNNQFQLNTDNIRLSTKDSIIQIDKIHLQPQTLFWKEQHTLPEAYLNAKVRSIEAKGVHFRRENASNYLQARSFDVMGSDIQYFDIQQDKGTKSKIQTNDTLNLSWTLYTMVSPILHSISINKIGIDEARLKYTRSLKGITDVYDMDQFNFEAYGFKIDSLADIQQRFLYSEGFFVEAANIGGMLASQNRAMGIGRMKLNTVTKDLQIKDITVSPLSLKTDRDYISGTIDSISFSGLKYDKGIIADQLIIDVPKVEYVRLQKGRRVKDSTDVNNNSINLDVITPFFNHISIKQINLNRGNITYRDKTSKDNMVYRLPRIDFFASNFLINEATIQHSFTFFAYDNIRFSFERFDNILPDKKYRLIIKKGVFTGIGGNLELRDIKLLSQDGSKEKLSDVYLSFVSSFMLIRKIDYKPQGKSTITFNSLNLESPYIRIVKNRESYITTKEESSKTNKPLNFIAGTLDITNADVEYFNKITKDSLRTRFEKLQFKALSWDGNLKKTLIESIILKSPTVNYHEFPKVKISGRNTTDYSGNFKGALDVTKIDISNIKIGINQPDLKFNFGTPGIDIQKLRWNNENFDLASLDVIKPEVKINQISNTTKAGKIKSEKQDFYSILGKISRKISVDKFNIADANIDYASTLNGKLNKQQLLNTTSLFFSGLTVDNDQKTFALNDINFSTRNFHFPMNNGFYTLQAKAIDLKKNEGSLIIDNLRLVPAYPKREFAYHHPTHKDWFDVGVGHISLSGIDFNRYMTNKIFHAENLLVKDVELLNFKNQQIEIQHNIMPMIYEGLQKMPLQFDVDTANIENFKVVYEELPKKGNTSGVIFFTKMNGRLSGLTNIVSRPKQYIQLNADGNLMGSGYFTATWMLPVDSLNDHFHLKAHLHKFDLKDLNQLITPMASARVEDGYVKSLTFSTDASSTGATIDMLMLYNDLNISVLRNKDGELTTNTLVSTIANKVIKKNNPDKKNRKPRQIHVTIERDAYHSTFNYLWQILQPAVVESVGFSQKKQNLARKVSGFFNKVKNIFRSNKEENKKDAKGHPDKK